jgi:O-antigen ligase
MIYIFKIKKKEKRTRLGWLDWDQIDRESIESRKTEIEKRGALKTHERQSIKKKPNPFSRKDRACQKIIEYGILGLIVWIPLPKASVPGWSVLVMQVSVFVMMGAYILMEKRPRNHEVLDDLLKGPRYLFYALFGLIVLQILPFPNSLVKILSPHSYSFRQMYSPGFADIKFMSISLMPGQTIKEGLELLTYFLMGFLILKTVTRRYQFMRIFYFVVGMGVFQAFYGFFELYSPDPRLLFYKKIYYTDCVTGTFVNRNHFSGYLEMVIPLALGMILARTDLYSTAGLKWRQKLVAISEKGVYKSVLLALGIISMALAVIFSKSRSGAFLVVFTFILVFETVVLFFGRLRHQQKWIKNFLTATFLIITLIALYTGIDATVERFSMDKILKDVRPQVWSNTGGIIGDFALFGSGLGTFEALYPAYEETSTPPLFEHAHNDYLEYLAELGILGFLLLLGGIVILIVFCFMAWRLRQDSGVMGLVLGGMVAVVVLLLHSITDFNLHIPANMMLFAVVLGLTLTTAFFRRDVGSSV